MKSTTTLLLTLVLCQYLLHSQATMPDGVPPPFLWGKTEYHPNGMAFHTIYEKGDSVFLFSNHASAVFNFNPALSFGEVKPEIRLPFYNRDLSKMTIFTVFHPADSMVEKSVWSLEKNSVSNLLLTTHRMADIEQVKFMNFPNERKGLPILNTYSQFKQADSIAIGNQFLILGEKPTISGIPVVPFNGKLAEILVFDKVLAPIEQQKVESYLAIKYGIPLSPHGSGNYLNSHGETLRDGKKFRPFSNRVTGIGRDDVSGLFQKQSASSYDPELLTIAVGQLATDNASNLATLENNTFLLCGDDNAAFALGQKEQGKPHFVSRKWVTTAFGETQEVATEMRFDVRRMGIDFKEGETWWLAIDRSGSGNFPSNAVEYYAVKQVTPAGVAVFKDIRWDGDRSGADLFTIGIAPEMMSKFWIMQPLCFPETAGSMDVGAEGGKPPYSLELNGLDHVFHEFWTSPDNRLTHVKDILPGDYVLTITDRTGRVTHDTIFVQSADAPVSKLASTYILQQGEILTLDAGKDLPDGDYQFAWDGPDGFSENLSQIMVSALGTYVLTISQNGCESRQEIEVKAFPTNNFRKVELYPNPAPGGVFQLAVYLHQPAQVGIRINDSIGKVVYVQSLSGSDYHKNRIRLNSPPGMYFVSVISEKTTRSFKLVIP